MIETTPATLYSEAMARAGFERGERREAGFTLLEVLVAAAIAAIGFAVILHTALDGARAARAAGDYEKAMVLARSHLALLGRDAAALPPDSSGHDGAFGWRLRVTRERIAEQATAIVDRVRYGGAKRAALFAIDIDISWMADGARRDLHVATKQVGLVAPPSDQSE